MNLAEALALGFGSGPICVASCGPVLLPWLGAEPRDLGTTSRLLAIFLGGRLAGYLAFAVVAWAIGVTLPVDLRTRETYRYRRIFFITLGFLFPVGFIWDLIALRSSMSIPKLG
jgi:sulfite exporter TauE/SafE